ncbi:prolyl oligopeptidase family serine peptidase [Shimia sp. R11_0]|uniref:alpha/beta hydrolase family esterase n=1 Tax=Shimia sp. R11_0 TaxID=2821096 RepID=UPI001ADACB52|nr:prolyl oligopeptidase family serine peptidase [Shimia sp. R11_0]
MIKRLLAVSAIGVLGASPVLAGCGADSAACTLNDRIYDIELPETPAAGNPAVIFMHGYGGSGKGLTQNRALVKSVLERGYAFVAPTGLPMGEGRRGFRWAFRGPEQAQEINFLKTLKQDLADRFDISSDQVLLSGFSNGAFMTVYTACETPDAFAAYAAVAGGFWRPHPQRCAAPVNLHMTHGWVDPVVPLEGRILRGISRDDPNALIQGDIFQTLEIFREAGECTRNRPDEFSVSGSYQIRGWTECSADTTIQFALHPGGHRVPSGWADLAIDWFETR